MNERIILKILLQKIEEWWNQTKIYDEQIFPAFVSLAELLKEYLKEDDNTVDAIDINILWERNRINKILNKIDEPYSLSAIATLLEYIQHGYETDTFTLMEKISTITAKFKV